MERSSITKPNKSPELPTAEQQLFMGTVVTLTWQLLIVVVVPFVGGHFLDEHLGTTPVWTLAGLGLALILAGLATYRGYQTLAQAKNKDSK
jgi:F0F1-type ATP synthase assembly protein I